MKKTRQQKMLELIAQYEIETQDELIARLRDIGVEVTQATVSRDIRELKIAKMTTGKGTYRYVAPKQSETPTAGSMFNSTLTDSIISADHAMNITVLKTIPGLANAVAVGIDTMNMAEILGCVAGDDTILIVTREPASAEALSDRFRSLIRG